jgi:hypothetical protein
VEGKLMCKESNAALKRAPLKLKQKMKWKWEWKLQGTKEEGDNTHKAQLQVTIINISSIALI